MSKTKVIVDLLPTFYIIVTIEEDRVETYGFKSYQCSNDLLEEIWRLYDLENRLYQHPSDSYHELKRIILPNGIRDLKKYLGNMAQEGPSFNTNGCMKTKVYTFHLGKQFN